MAERTAKNPRGAGLKKGHKFSPEMIQRRLARIDFDKIVQRLENTVIDGEGPLKTNQLQAAALLLDRVAPKLSSTEINGEITRTTVIRAPETVANSKTWLEQHGPARVSPDPKPDQVN